MYTIHYGHPHPDFLPPTLLDTLLMYPFQIHAFICFNKPPGIISVAHICMGMDLSTGAYQGPHRQEDGLLSPGSNQLQVVSHLG